MSKLNTSFIRRLTGSFGAIGLTFTLTLAGATPAGAMLMNSGGGGGGATGGSGGGSFGTANIAKFTDGLEFYALVACIVAIFISAILWAIGSKGQNPGQELTGKRGLILAVTAAFFIGAIPGVMGFLDTQAHSADTSGVTTAGAATGGAAGTQAAGTNCSFANNHQANC